MTACGKPETGSDLYSPESAASAPRTAVILQSSAAPVGGLSKSPLNKILESGAIAPAPSQVGSPNLNRVFGHPLLEQQVEVPGGQPVIGKPPLPQPLPRCCGPPRRLRSQKVAKVRLSRAPVVPQMRQHLLHAPRQAVVIIEDRLVVVRRRLQHPGGTLYSRLGLFHLKMKEGGPHPHGRKIRRRLLSLLEAVACLFLLPVLQHRFPKLAPSIRRSRLSPERFPQLFPLPPAMLPAQRNRGGDRQYHCDAGRRRPHNILPHRPHRIPLAIPEPRNGVTEVIGYAHVSTASARWSYS